MVSCFADTTTFFNFCLFDFSSFYFYLQHRADCFRLAAKFKIKEINCKQFFIKSIINRIFKSTIPTSNSFSSNMLSKLSGIIPLRPFKKLSISSRTFTQRRCCANASKYFMMMKCRRKEKHFFIVFWHYKSLLLL